MSAHEDSDRQTAQLRPYTLKDLAALYHTSKPTMRLWLRPFQDELGPRIGYKYSTQQVAIIFRKLLLPELIDPTQKIT